MTHLVTLVLVQGRARVEFHSGLALSNIVAHRI